MKKLLQMKCNQNAVTPYVFLPYKVTEVVSRGLPHESPRPRSGHRIVCNDTHLYCFGGYNPSLPEDGVYEENPTWTPERPLFKELWSFCIATRHWKQHRVVENMPDELASNAMCMDGRNIMVFGGTGAPFGNHCSNELLTWRVCEGDVQLRRLEARGQKPPGQYGQAVVCIDGYFYTIGGTNGYAYTCDIFRLDLRSLAWETVFIGTGQDGEPLGRYRHELALLGKNLYLLAGGTGEWAFQLMELPVFNLEKKTWSQVTPKVDSSLTPPLGPLPRKCHSAVQINTPHGVQVFVAGGSDGVSVFDDVWRLDLPSAQWTWMQKTVLPSPLYFHSAAVTPQGCMYMFGGIEPKNDAASRNNNLYKVWLCIPKLSEMSWEALLYYNPDLGKHRKATLLDTGIPMEFVDRVKGC